jgi:hypothetical protein
MQQSNQELAMIIVIDMQEYSKGSGRSCNIYMLDVIMVHKVMHIKEEVGSTCKQGCKNHAKEPVTHEGRTLKVLHFTCITIRVFWDLVEMIM